MQMEQGTAPSASYVASTDSLEKIELQAIQETIRHNHGNISAAARQLGVSRTTLYRKLKQTGLLPSAASGEPAAQIRPHAITAPDDGADVLSRWSRPCPNECAEQRLIHPETVVQK